MANYRRVVSTTYYGKPDDRMVLRLECGHDFTVNSWTIVCQAGPLDVTGRDCLQCCGNDNLREKFLRQAEVILGNHNPFNLVEILDQFDDLVDETLHELGDRLMAAVPPVRRGILHNIIRQARGQE